MAYHGDPRNIGSAGGLGGTAIGGYTITTTAQTAGQSQTMVQSATSRLQAHNGDFSKAICDLRDILDRLIGGNPQEGNKTGPCPVPSGDLGALHHEIDSHQNMLTMLQDQVSRLRAV